MNYEPNQLARALATGHSNLIGVIVPNSSDPYYAEVIRAIEDAASAVHYHVLLGNGSLPDGDVHGPRARHAAPAHEGHHRGAAVHVGATAAAEVLEGPATERLPGGADQPATGPAGLPPGGGRLHGGRGDAGARAGRARAPARGLHLGPPVRAPVPAASRDLQALRRRSTASTATSRLFEAGELSGAGGYAACQRLWESNPRKPTAIVASHEIAALGVLRYLDEAGIDVPGEVSVGELRRDPVCRLHASQPDDGGDAAVRDREAGLSSPCSTR